MLAVTANWMLTDGTLAPTRAGAAEDWLCTIRRAAIRAGVGNDGRYRPVDSVCLVFAGDTFDWLLSDVWSGRDRPWHGGGRGREARASVVASSLRASSPVIAGVRRWIRRGMPLPAADARGRPSARHVCHVPTRVVMLAGDRDAWLSEGLAEPGEFAHRFGVWVGESWLDGRVNRRHGHDLDPIAHAILAAPPHACGRRPALAESLAVDLIVPFAVALRSETVVWNFARPRLATIAAAGPAAMPLAVARLVTSWGADGTTGRRLLRAWRQSVAAWKKTARRDPPFCEAEFDAVDALASWFEEAAEEAPACIPQALARLAVPRANREPAGSVLGHVLSGETSIALGDPGGPWLAVIGRDQGEGWLEPLGQPAAGPRVVTIGGGPGDAVVEAA
jgi:hypothetical protein